MLACNDFSTLSNMQSVTVVFIIQSFLNIISANKDIQPITLQMLTAGLIRRRRKTIFSREVITAFFVSQN